MFSTIFSIVLAVGFICIGSGIDAEQKSAYKAVVNCIQTGWKALGSGLPRDNSHADKAEKIKGACMYFKVRFVCRAMLPKVAGQSYGQSTSRVTA